MTSMFRKTDSIHHHPDGDGVWRPLSQFCHICGLRNWFQEVVAYRISLPISGVVNVEERPKRRHRRC